MKLEQVFFRKFNVYRREQDGSNGEQVVDEAFTLVPAHDPAALPALEAYAAAVRDKNPGLASDLDLLVARHR